MTDMPRGSIYTTTPAAVSPINYVGSHNWAQIIGQALFMKEEIL